MVRSLQIPQILLDAAVASEEVELKRRERIYRGHRPWREIAGKTVILVDDGIATGSTMRAAIHVLRKQNPARIVVAVPYAPQSVYDELEGEADEMVILNSTEVFWAVGQAYANFSPVSDEEVSRIMEMAERLPEKSA
jgi:predicted phosphoribosyltransferase